MGGKGTSTNSGRRRSKRKSGTSISYDRSRRANKRKRLRNSRQGGDGTDSGKKHPKRVEGTSTADLGNNHSEVSRAKYVEVKGIGEKETCGTRRGKRERGRSIAHSGDKHFEVSASKNTLRRCVSKVEINGMEFKIGEDVYVRKFESTGSDSDIEVEDCRICGANDEETMLECDTCLFGFHLKCLDPPLEDVPEGDWSCPYCEKGVRPPQTSNHRHRSARERLLARDLWAARIEQMWREKDRTYWFRARWFLVPEDIPQGRKPYNGKRELFRSSESDENEMESILRHCYVMNLQDYKKSSGEGDDVFYCEYEYNERWCKFKRIDYLGDNENVSEDSDEPFDADESEEEDDPGVFGSSKRRRSIAGKAKQRKRPKAANKGRSYLAGIAELGTKVIPEHLRKQPQTDFERAKGALALSAIPSSLPCRDRERKEIASFVKDSVAAGEHCLGRCLYISGVPGTGKTATVLEVIKELGVKVDLGELPQYRFVEINGLRLPSPEHAYTVLHEALTGQHVGWKRALHFLDERFTNSRLRDGLDARPCVLLVDELDLLVTRNQSVLYNIFDWPTRLHSRLIIIGIANTMDLPERMLPRIASRMGMQRISFAPYSHKQLEEIITTRLAGVKVFDKQAAEFASRKVAAVSGDIRRALELCRRAVEVAEIRLKGQPLSLDSSASCQSSPGLHANGRLITMADVDAAISEMFEAPQIQMMRRSAKLAKLFLVAMVCEQRRTSMTETTFEKVALTCSELCSTNGEERPDWDTLLSIGCKLGACRLLLCEPAVRHRLQKLQLNCPCEDVSFALKNDEQAPWLAKYL